MSMHIPEFRDHRHVLQRLVANCSVEITVKDAPDLVNVVGVLEPGTPISITCLPNEDPATRIAVAKRVLDLGFFPVPHIAVRRFPTLNALEEHLCELSAIGAAQSLFIVAGDCSAKGVPFHDSLALIESGLLRKYGVDEVLVAGYPEGHPQIANDQLDTALMAKISILEAQGCKATILTQFGFDHQPVAIWLAELRAKGIDAPVRLGVPGPASAARLMRFATRCGVAATKSALAKYGLSLTKLMQPTGPDRFITALGETLSHDVHGTVGLHYYPFGGVLNTAAWIRAFAQMASQND